MEQILLGYGLPGIVILALGIAYDRKDKECRDWQQKALEQASLRTTDLKEIDKARSERDVKVATMVEFIYNKLMIAKRG